MTSERPTDDADADATLPWMSGLAGRPGTGSAHADGARLRAALAPDAPQATWRDIEARAAAEPVTGVDAAPAAARLRPDGPPAGKAANDPSPWRWFGWAAALLLGVGLVTLVPTGGDDAGTSLRGLPGPVQQGPRWLVERPLESAEALAAELRALHAEVTVTREGAAAILHIRARPDAVGAVNARLAVLETGLDAEGRLRLEVVPVR